MAAYSGFYRVNSLLLPSGLGAMPISLLGPVGADFEAR